MPLSDHVVVNITANTSSPSRPGFGTILIASCECPPSFTNRVGTITDTDGLVALGFSANSATYKCVEKILSQPNKVQKIKIGRRANKPIQTVTLEVTSAAVGAVYTLGKIGSTVVTYTVPGGSPTTTTVATAIAALIDADAAVAATSTGAIITCTGAAGVLYDISDISPLFKIKNTTADPGLAADLAAIKGEDNDWYGLALDSNSESEILVAAAFAEANEKQFGCNTLDTETTDPVVTNCVLSDLKAGGYDRTVCFYNGKNLQSYAGAAMLGNRYTATPGSDTWKFKTLAGVFVDKLSAGAYAAIKDKNGNVYTETSGINMTEEGISSGGEFPDTIRFLDWLKAEMKVQIFSLFVNSEKVPFTDPGIDTVVLVGQSVLQQGIANGGLAADPAPVMTAPTAAQVDKVSKAARTLPGLKFTGVLAGAIHKGILSGTVTV